MSDIIIINDSDHPMTIELPKADTIYERKPHMTGGGHTMLKIGSEYLDTHLYTTVRPITDEAGNYLAWVNTKLADPALFAAASDTAARLREVEAENRKLCQQSLRDDETIAILDQRVTAAEQELERMTISKNYFEKTAELIAENCKAAESQRDGLLKAAKFVLEHAEMLPGLRAPLGCG